MGLDVFPPPSLFKVLGRNFHWNRQLLGCFLLATRHLMVFLLAEKLHKQKWARDHVSPAVPGKEGQARGCSWLLFQDASNKENILSGKHEAMFLRAGASSWPLRAGWTFHSILGDQAAFKQPFWCQGRCRGRKSFRAESLSPVLPTRCTIWGELPCHS